MVHKQYNFLKVLAVLATVSIITAGRAQVFPGLSWAKTSPEAQGVDSAKLKEAFKYLAAKMDVSQTVVVRNGHIIHRGSNAGKTQGLWSCSKSFTSTVLGLMVDSQKISLDDYAWKYASELKSKYSKLQIKHFATMTSGYDAPGGSYGPNSQDGSGTSFKPSSPNFSPGAAYAYWDDAQRMFGAVLSAALNKNFANLFKDRIASKIGIKNYSWNSRDGSFHGLTVADSAGGVSMNAENVARFLHLFLNKGKWNGQQLISEEWVDEATSVQVPADLPFHKKSQNYVGPGVYGYNWWVNGERKDGTLLWPDAPESTFSCIGAKGNMGLVIPEWNMVIVRLGSSGSNGAATFNQFLKRVKAAIL